MNKKKVRYRVVKYVILDNQLYKCEYLLLLLKCLAPKMEIISDVKSMRGYVEIILKNEHLLTKL